MNLPSFSISWVDFLSAIILLIGFLRGRKRGLSEELLDTVQWVLIVITAGLFYKQVGELLHMKSLVSQLSAHIFSYLLIALVLKILFTVLKRLIGQKLVDSDVFGRGEFYMGMLAGMLRWVCMYVFILSLFHAPNYTPEYREKKAKEDDYNYGMPAPSLMGVQDEIYRRSFTGKYTEKYLTAMLIEPSTGDAQKLRGDNSMGRRREREVDAIMGR